MPLFFISRGQVLSGQPSYVFTRSGYPSVDGHLGGVHLLAVVNPAAVNIGI